MTDENNINQNANYFRSPTDNALTHLVMCANSGAGMGVTLVVDGQVITGNLISGKAYAEHSAKAIRSVNADPSLTDAMAKFFDNLAQEYVPHDDYEIPLDLLHLEQPSYLTGNGQWLTMNDSIIRIPLENVSGFSLGKLI